MSSRWSSRSFPGAPSTSVPRSLATAGSSGHSALRPEGRSSALLRSTGGGRAAALRLKLYSLLAASASPGAEGGPDTPPLDRRRIRALDPVDADLLDGEGRADGAVEDRAAERSIVQRSRLREVAEQPSGERVAGARGVANLIERVRGRPEDPVR